MKNLTIAILCSSFLFAGNAQVKLYEVKSGKVTYEIKGSGNPMGTKMKIVGKKRLIFDNYGANNLIEENRVKRE